MPARNPAAKPKLTAPAPTFFATPAYEQRETAELSPEDAKRLRAEPEATRLRRLQQLIDDSAAGLRLEQLRRRPSA